MIVKQILTNPIYLGNLVQLKTYTLSYKNRKQVKNEPEDMVTIYNTHEAIVTQELWDKCREMEASVSQGKKNKTGYVNPLSGLVYCADCGNKMYIAWNNTRHKRTDPRTYHRENFKCGAYSKFGDRVCSSHYNPSNPAPHSQRKGTQASPLHRKITHVVSDYGLTCGQTQKTGLFQPQFGKEQAHLIYRENASFHELLRENKRKTGIVRFPFFWSE